MKKKLLRFAFLGAAVVGVAELAGAGLTWILCRFATVPGFSRGEAATIGIIGGADGPTAVFITGPRVSEYIFPTILLIVGITGLLLLRRQKQK